uniref:C2H2-type domain-containing protein n=1 Tax=Poecilia mexicana TaxID=48701 RepID=A0A3B3YHE4_9TELE
MEDVFQTRVLLRTSDVKKEADVDQQEALHLQIKEEEEELCVSEEGEQLRVKEETDGRFPSTAASISSKDVKEEPPENQSPDVDPFDVKEENSKICSSHEEKLLRVKEEPDYSRFPLNIVYVNSEDDEEKPVMSQLHQPQTENGDFPTSSSGDQIKAEIEVEICGAAESSRNPDINTPGGTLSHSETDDEDEDEEDDDDDDDDDDWNHHESQHSQLSDSVTKDGDQKSHLDKDGNIPVGDEPFDCDFCGKSFSLKSSLNNHVKIHTGEKSCDFCGKTFNSSSDLKKHMRVHTGEKPFCCEDCGKRFSLSASLNRHRRVHTEEKPFGCDVCGKRFTVSSYLEKHMRIHTQEKLFSCNDCGETFSLGVCLKRHMRIHTGEKPFGCDVCGKRFNLKSNLNVHMRVHTGQKPFGCDECGLKFSTNSNLKEHMRIHKDEKAFACDECGKRF